MPEFEPENVRKWRYDNNLTQETAARKLGIHRGHLAKIESGATPITEKISRKLESLGVKGNPGSSLTPVSLHFGPLVPLPIVGGVSAGPGEHSVDFSDTTIYVPQSLGQSGSMGYVIDGESMMPALEPGDVAVFRETSQPRRGFTFLLKRPDDGFSVKTIEYDIPTGKWIMVSLNPAFPPESMENVQIKGLLIGWYRSRGKYEKLEADPDGLRLT